MLDIPRLAMTNFYTLLYYRCYLYNPCRPSVLHAVIFCILMSITKCDILLIITGWPYVDHSTCWLHGSIIQPWGPGYVCLPHNVLFQISHDFWSIPKQISATPIQVMNFLYEDQKCTTINQGDTNLKEWSYNIINPPLPSYHMSLPFDCSWRTTKMTPISNHGHLWSALLLYQATWYLCFSLQGNELDLSSLPNQNQLPWGLEIHKVNLSES